MTSNLRIEGRANPVHYVLMSHNSRTDTHRLTTKISLVFAANNKNFFLAYDGLGINLFDVAHTHPKKNCLMPLVLCDAKVQLDRTVTFFVI